MNTKYLRFICLILIAIGLFGCKGLKGISFDVNSVTLPEDQLAGLDEVGERLKANPSLQVTLRGYFAPERTTQSQIHRGDGTPALSAARAEWCAEYLTDNYGVSGNRITIEYRDAKKDAKLYSFVEIVVR